jgi:RHS repeat-associated protein
LKRLSTNTCLYGNGRIGEYESDWAYYLPDALGSVRQMANPTGGLILLQSYQPYGSVIDSAGDVTSNYGFTGEWTDATGLQHLRARYYNTGIARFISRDVWAGDYNNPLSLNKWMYVEGNPVNLTDPSGLVICDITTRKENLVRCYVLAGYLKNYALGIKSLVAMQICYQLRD